MSDAFKALADIRRWACETLDDGDAGRLCGMLSEVSRHINGLETKNEQLRNVIGLCGEYVSDGRCEGCIVKHACDNGDIDDCWMKILLTRMMSDLGIEVE